MIEIRDEQLDDVDAVREVYRQAFNQEQEGRIVDALRERGVTLLSLVAVTDGVVVGHIMFSPMTIESEAGTWDAVCLAPVAVAPARQKQGIGGMLIEVGLAELRGRGQRAVILLGHPSYYPRFGFRPAREFGLHYQDDRDAFMAI